MQLEQMNAVIALENCLPALVEQLKVMNELKAIELKQNIHPSMQAPDIWVKSIDNALKRD